MALLTIIIQLNSKYLGLLSQIGNYFLFTIEKVLRANSKILVNSLSSIGMTHF